MAASDSSPASCSSATTATAAAEVAEAVDVGVERLGAHAETLGHPPEADGVHPAGIVDEGHRSVHDGLTVEPHRCGHGAER